ncbi:hypothetical protein C4K00_3581 [Pseudomonas synxantha]|nr:hypothetical protein C4K00_3581 [Pseudomonas synxantha]
MPHRQKFRAPWAIQQLATIQRRRRSVVEQGGGVQQRIFKTQVVVDVVEPWLNRLSDLLPCF